MICKTKSRRSASAYKSVVEPPSLARIAQMTAKIRETWSEKTKSSRAGYDPSHVEIVVVSSALLSGLSGFRANDA